jgi:ribose 5-phosphate isomerase B
MIVETWLDTNFEEGGRHQKRVDMIRRIEEDNYEQ